MVVPVSKVLESRTVTVGEECRVKLGHCIYPSAKILAIGDKSVMERQEEDFLSTNQPEGDLDPKQYVVCEEEKPDEEELESSDSDTPLPAKKAKKGKQKTKEKCSIDLTKKDKKKKAGSIITVSTHGAFQANTQLESDTFTETTCISHSSTTIPDMGSNVISPSKTPIVASTSTLSTLQSITTTAMSAISPFSFSTSASSLVPMPTSEEDSIVINTDTTSDSDDYSAENLVNNDMALMDLDFRLKAVEDSQQYILEQISHLQYSFSMLPPFTPPFTPPPPPSGKFSSKMTTSVVAPTTPGKSQPLTSDSTQSPLPLNKVCVHSLPSSDINKDELISV